MKNQIYPSELQLNNSNTSDIRSSFWDVHLSISNDIVSTNIYDKRGDISHFEMAMFLVLHPMEFIRFTRESSYVADFATRSTLLTKTHLKQGYQYHKHCKTLF